MTTLLAIVAGLAVLIVVAGLLVLRWWAMDELGAQHDPVVNIDQWTDARRRRLVEFQRPAAKGIDARRKQS